MHGVVNSLLLALVLLAILLRAPLSLENAATSVLGNSM